MISSNSGLLLFGQVVAGVLREQALRLLIFSQARPIVIAGRVIQKCSKSRGMLSTRIRSQRIRRDSIHPPVLLSGPSPVWDSRKESRSTFLRAANQSGA